MTTAADDSAAVEALAEAWASMDGKAEKFRACKADREAEMKMGHYRGYLADAEGMIERLEDRGYTIVAKPPAS